MRKWVTIGIAVVVSTFIAANAILLFSEKSKLTRTYYVHEFDRVHESTYAQELEKESVVVPVNEVTVTVDVEVVTDFTVVPGDVVQQGIELVQLKTEAADNQRMIWEAEQQAYMAEQTQLQQIISSLESEQAGASTNFSDIDTSTGSVGDEETSVNVQVDVNVSPEGQFSQAIAEAQQKLAEVDRKLQIISTQLSQESSELAILSPIDGNVASIEEREGLYFITIYTNEKTVRTFANETEWHDIQEGQQVINSSSHQEGVVEGSVFAKSQIPADHSKWLLAYEQYNNKKEEPLYEVQIQLNDQIDALPYAATINSVIHTNEAENAVRVKSEWLLDRIKENAEVYTLTEEGKIIRTPVVAPFDLKQYTILSEGLESEAIVLNEESKINGSPAFLPFPMDLPTWNSIKAVGWKDYLKYLTYE